MKNSRARYLAVAAVVALAVAACGGSDPAEELAEQIAEQAGGDVADIDIDAADGSMAIDINDDDGDGSVSIDTDNDGSVAIEIEDDDGGGTLIIGGGEVPEGFPIPVLEGGQVVSSLVASSDEGSGGVVSVEYPAGTFDALVSSYQSWIDDQDLDVSRMDMTTDEGKTVQFFGTGEDGGSVMIIIGETGDGVVVALTAGD